MNVLVTGGAGYIGSHTVVELLNAGHNAIIVDDLSNAKADVVDRIETITGKRPAFYKRSDCIRREVKFFCGFVYRHRILCRFVLHGLRPLSLNCFVFPASAH